MKKSVVFISTIYYSTFFLRDELRKRGWKADIYIPRSYPMKLLFSVNDILQEPRSGLAGRLGGFADYFLRFFYFLWLVLRYRNFVFYGRPQQFPFLEARINKGEWLGRGFSVSLAILQATGRTIIVIPSGCLEEETRANISKLDGGNVCGNCGWPPGSCDDRINTRHFAALRRYSAVVVGNGTLLSTQYKAVYTRFQMLDLSRWNPATLIPERHRLPAVRSIRILHSFFNADREHGNKNIKGSPFVIEAIERLKNEGHDVLYYYLNDVKIGDMVYYQNQADIIIDQLIYGWWGYTGMEGMALGKPVVCYLRQEWKDHFLKINSEFSELPIVEANTSTIYEVLKRLVVDEEYRMAKGRESRRFAERYFDTVGNSRDFERLLRS